MELVVKYNHDSKYKHLDLACFCFFVSVFFFLFIAFCLIWNKNFFLIFIHKIKLFYLNKLFNEDIEQIILSQI